MTIERITPLTAEEVATIYVKSWQTAYKGIMPQDFLDKLDSERWSSWMGSSESETENYALKDEGRFVATASIGPARDEKMKGWGEIVTCYVLPECFRKGYGTAIFDYGVGRLRELGFQDIYLWVAEKNPRARAFYESRGFVATEDILFTEIHGTTVHEIRYLCKFK